MSRQFESCAVLSFLAVASLNLAQNRPVSTSFVPQVTVSVYNYAGVSTEIMARAETEARRVFLRAGVHTTWLTCLVRKEVVPQDCQTVDATHLVLKILPHALNAKVRDRSDVLGAAIVDESGSSYYAYVFYERVQGLAKERRLGSALLANVIVHELGHLLLESNSHAVSGIMSGHWSGEELRKISEGNMFFHASESSVIRDRLISSQGSVFSEQLAASD